MLHNAKLQSSLFILLLPLLQTYSKKLLLTYLNMIKVRGSHIKELKNLTHPDKNMSGYQNVYPFMLLK